jgi:hypothetical protein
MTLVRRLRRRRFKRAGNDLHPVAATELTARLSASSGNSRPTALSTKLRAFVAAAQ